MLHIICIDGLHINVRVGSLVLSLDTLEFEHRFKVPTH